jgi:hypothetical protein
MSDTDETAARTEPTADVADTSTSADITATSADVSLPSAPPTPGQKRRGRRALLIASLIVVVLAACGFGGYSFVAQQYNQLNALGAQMCNDLQTHKYDSLYQHFSAALKAKFTEAEFSHYGAEIDQSEGSALRCGQADGNHFTFDLGKRTITVASVVNRVGTGAHSGNVRFLFTTNSWQVDDFDVGFLGVSLDALKLFDNYCAALQKPRFQDIYTMLASNLRGQSEQEYLQTENLHLQVDGVATECVLEGISAKNTTTSSTLSLHIQRQKHYSAGAMTFGSTSSGWAITAIDPALEGRDLDPVYIANRWCSDIQSHNYKDSLGLFTTKLQQATSLAVYSDLYSGKQGVSWLNCSVDPTSYQGYQRPSDINVALKAHVQLKNVKTGAQTQGDGKIGLELENAQWKIDIVFLFGGYCFG